MFRWNGLDIPVVTLGAAVAGSGAAGFSAAGRLHELGITDVALVTEGADMGTSRNTGSDKQTYYKLSLCGDEPDSVQDMAKTYFAGGSMDGDTALVEAAMSAGSFTRLAGLGVPFPHNAYSEYAGYKTDHDPRRRATSAGPLTSKFMTEALEADARRRGIRIYDGFLVIGILTSKQKDTKCLGMLALDTERLGEPARGLTLFRTANVVWATGGEAGLFEASVYPESQHGALGVALEAGAGACGLTEWQHGLASVKFRWNVSGTYQQVLPRYVSANADGSGEREFLLEYLSPEEALKLTFLKGYQWPFDARKLPGSSQIDIYAYIETNVRNRRVFLDYRANPAGLEGGGFASLSEECRDYLAKSGALFGTPVERLEKMNPDAVRLYQTHGIDIRTEPLEVAVCAQHMNGGLEVDKWWMTNIKGLYACGEAAGTFGTYRPGGSALNSTQTGSQRAALHIAVNRRDAKAGDAEFEAAAAALLGAKGTAALRVSTGDKSNLPALLANARRRMSRAGAHLRKQADISVARKLCEVEIKTYWKNMRLASAAELPDAFRGWDMLISQYACLSAMREYIRLGGPSRGSALVLDDEGEAFPGVPWKCRPYSEAMDGNVLQTELSIESGRPVCRCGVRPVRPIPERDLWFENVWAEYRAGKAFQ
jgi:succinate dehydrogenase/fumarate reductase flavoprotein subunit